MGLAACSAPQCPSLAAPEGWVPGPPQGTKQHHRVSGQPAAVLPPADTAGTGERPKCPNHLHTGLRWAPWGRSKARAGRGPGGGWLELLWCSPGTASSLRSSAPGGAPWVRAQHGGVGWTRCSWCRGTEHSKGSVAEGRAWCRCCTLTCSQKAACTAHLPGHPPPRCPACAGSHPRTAKIQR